MTSQSDAGVTDDLRRRARRLEDIEELKQLAVRYKHALDDRDLPAYVELFAANGTLWCGPELQATGRPAIRDLVQGMSGNLLTDEIGADFHATGNHLVEVDGDRGTGSLIWLYFTVAGDGRPLLSKIGHYVDQYVREDGRWRFQRREAPTDIPIV
jgi:hypothetical protein